jgi:hypothetical protein
MGRRDTGAHAPRGPYRRSITRHVDVGTRPRDGEAECLQPIAERKQRARALTGSARQLSGQPIGGVVLFLLLLRILVVLVIGTLIVLLRRYMTR